MNSELTVSFISYRINWIIGTYTRRAIIIPLSQLLSRDCSWLFIDRQRSPGCEIDVNWWRGPRSWTRRAPTCRSTFVYRTIEIRGHVSIKVTTNRDDFSDKQFRASGIQSVETLRKFKDIIQHWYVSLH